MIEVIIESIRVNPSNYQRMVFLKEKDGDRCLYILIGPAEADAIAVKLQEIKVPRPLTHDLLQSVISLLGGSVREVMIHDLRNDTFYALISIETKDAGRTDIDSRPSDAVALAVRVGVPIYVAEAVMDEAGILLDEATGRPIVPEERGQQSPEKPPEVKEEELRRMSAFTDFIDTLDLEDLGKERNDDSSSPR